MKGEAIVKYKRWLDSYRDTYSFCCLLTDGFFQIIYLVSFDFNLNGVEAEPIFSKPFQY